jgi:polar amino acid transport system substrate-binding protein
VIVRTAASIISPGTEKMVMELAKKTLIGKARERPDLVRQVITKVRTHGVVTTFQNVVAKMDKPLPLGYSAAGVIESVSPEVLDLKVGDRVAIAGAGYASHAEINFVPRNLAALIPDSVSFEEAAYSTVAAIAMQGVRLARPELSEVVVVSGLGLIGLIAVQLLKASGCGCSASISTRIKSMPDCVWEWTKELCCRTTMLIGPSIVLPEGEARI